MATKLLRRRARAVVEFGKEVFSQWQDDQASRLAAALALYTLLSIAPLMVVTLVVAGAVFGEEAARGQLSREMSAVVGEQAGRAIEALVANARAPKAGILGSIVGIAVLLFGASGVFGELQAALNQIWDVKQREGRGLRGIIRDRFFSFSMVMGVAFLLLVSLVVSAVLATLTGRFSHLLHWPVLWQGLNTAIGLVVTTGLFALILKVVPDARIAWRDVWVGALFTALCFSLGKGALAWYVGRSAMVSPFGAAGSLVALTIWVYYSAQILFLGAEFAQVYATRSGRRIEPTKNAVPIDEPDPPQSNAPQSNAPQSNAPQSNAPQSNAPQSNAPQSNAPQSQANPPPSDPAHSNPAHSAT